MDTQSADQIKLRYRSELGGSLGELYHELENEYYWLQYKWQEYVVLFGSAPSRIDLLNQAAPAFFHHLQDVLWDDLLMHLSRLTDGATGKRGRRNLTFAALPPLLPRPLRGEVADLVAKALAAAQFARDWRNRRLAHRDLLLALGQPAEPLMPASRAAIKDALVAQHTVINRVHNHFFHTDIAQEVIEAPMGAEHLLYVLHEGVTAEAARLERLRSGSIRAEDLEPPPQL